MPGRKKSRKSQAAAARRLRESVLRGMLRELKKTGLYNPRKAPGEKILKLTRSRASSIRAAFQRLGDLSRRSVFAKFPRRAGKEAGEIGKEVERIGGTITRTGAFLPREEGELRRGEAVFRRNRQTGIWTARQTYTWTDKKTGARRTQSAELFLAGPEALEAQEKALRKYFEAAAKGMGPNQAIRFAIGGPQGNVSRRSFRSWDVFSNYVRGYRRDPRAQATFMASLTIYRVERETPRATRYRVPVGWVNARGRYQEAAPEMLWPGGILPLPAAEAKRLAEKSRVRKKSRPRRKNS